MWSVFCADMHRFVNQGRLLGRRGCAASTLARSLFEIRKYMDDMKVPEKTVCLSLLTNRDKLVHHLAHLSKNCHRPFIDAVDRAVFLYGIADADQLTDFLLRSAWRIVVSFDCLRLMGDIAAGLMKIGVSPDALPLVRVGEDFINNSVNLRSGILCVRRKFEFKGTIETLMFHLSEKLIWDIHNLVAGRAHVPLKHFVFVDGRSLMKPDQIRSTIQFAHRCKKKRFCPPPSLPTITTRVQQQAPVIVTPKPVKNLPEEERSEEKCLEGEAPEVPKEEFNPDSFFA
jgi:hypothetical protein